MAHANLHFALGMAVGTAIAAPPVIGALLRRAELARPLARLWLVSLACGAWAVMPNLVSAAGLTAGWHHARWADLFIGHRAIDRRVHGGLLIGELALIAQLVVHYGLLLWALRRRRAGS